MTHLCRVNIPILGVFSHTLRSFPILYRPMGLSFTTNCMQTVMNLMDTKYNFRRKENRNNGLPGLGYPRCQKKPGSECREVNGWNGVTDTVSGKDCLT